MALLYVNFVLFCGNLLVEEKGGAEGEREEIGRTLQGASRPLVVQDQLQSRSRFLIVNRPGRGRLRPDERPKSEIASAHQPAGGVGRCDRGLRSGLALPNRLQRRRVQLRLQSSHGRQQGRFCFGFDCAGSSFGRSRPSCFGGRSDCR